MYIRIETFPFNYIYLQSILVQDWFYCSTKPAYFQSRPWATAAIIFPVLLLQRFSKLLNFFQRKLSRAVPFWFSSSKTPRVLPLSLPSALQCLLPFLKYPGLRSSWNICILCFGAVQIFVQVNFKSCWKAAAYLDSRPRDSAATKSPLSAQCLLPRLREAFFREWLTPRMRMAARLDQSHFESLVEFVAKLSCILSLTWNDVKPVAKAESSFAAEIEGVKLVVKLELALEKHCCIAQGCL